MIIPDSDSSETYNISFDYRPEYLYVYVSGDHDSYDISRRYWQQIADECAKTNIKKVLIEEDIAETASMGEMFQLASEIPEMGFFGVRVAFVDRYIEHQDLNKFGELVANNRGLHGQIFNDVSEAEKWLLAE